MGLKTYNHGLIDDPGSVALGIDQSYTGFAITAVRTEGEPVFHQWLYSSQGTGVERLVQIRDVYFAAVAADLHLWDIDVSTAALEGYAAGAKFGRELAGELGGLTKVWLYDRYGLDPISVSPSSLKKYVTGKGTGVAKNQMLLYTYKKWGVEFHDDNLADSYGLARLVTGRCDLSYEKDVFAKLKR